MSNLNKRIGAVLKCLRLAHGILTCQLMLDCGGSSQGFGGYDLRPEGELFKWINGILCAVDVDRWEDLEGKFVRFEGGNQGRITGIGHICEDKWFRP